MVNYPKVYVQVAGAILSMLAYTQIAVAATAIPNSPSNICIDDTRCVTDNSPSLNSGIKWHPGYYLQILRGSTESSQSYRFGIYNEIASNTALKGVKWNPRWKELEGNSRGDYSAGFAMVRAEINKLKSLSVPKRLVIRINDVGYGNTYPAAGIFPTYLQGANCLFENTGGYTVTSWKKWDASCMGYYIDMIKAYGAEFDDEPYFEGIVLIREEALQLYTTPTSTSGFSGSAYVTQLRRLALAAKQAWPTTNVFMAGNYLSGSSQSGENSQMAYYASIGVGNFTPDTVPDGSGSWAEKSVIGTGGGSDLRGVLPIFQGAEVSEMGLDSVGTDGGYTPTQLATWANSTMHASHIAWDYNNFTGTSGQRWATGLLPYINSNPTPTYTACPSSYTTGCDTN